MTSAVVAPLTPNKQTNKQGVRYFGHSRDFACDATRRYRTWSEIVGLGHQSALNDHPNCVCRRSLAQPAVCDRSQSYLVT